MKLRPLNVLLPDETQVECFSLGDSQVREYFLVHRQVASIARGVVHELEIRKRYQDETHRVVQRLRLMPGSAKKLAKLLAREGP